MTPKETVVETLRLNLGIEAEQITPEADIFNDLGADSLDIVEVVMALEEELGIEIDDVEIEEIRTVGDLTNMVEKLAATKH